MHYFSIIREIDQCLVSNVDAGEDEINEFLTTCKRHLQVQQMCQKLLGAVTGPVRIEAKCRMASILLSTDALRIPQTFATINILIEKEDKHPWLVKEYDTEDGERFDAKILEELLDTIIEPLLECKREEQSNLIARGKGTMAQQTYGRDQNEV